MNVTALVYFYQDTSQKKNEAKNKIKRKNLFFLLKYPKFDCHIYKSLNTYVAELRNKYKSQSLILE